MKGRGLASFVMMLTNAKHRTKEVAADAVPFNVSTRVLMVVRQCY